MYNRLNVCPPKIYMYFFKYITFWKRQEHRDNGKVGASQGVGVAGGVAEHGVFQSRGNALYDT